jgi:hypothetical protein
VERKQSETRSRKPRTSPAEKKQGEESSKKRKRANRADAGQLEKAATVPKRGPGRPRKIPRPISPEAAPSIDNASSSESNSLPASQLKEFSLEDKKRIVVFNVSKDTDLEMLLSKIKEPKSVSRPSKDSATWTGNYFVELVMESEEDARLAVSALHRTVVHGNVIGACLAEKSFDLRECSTTLLVKHRSSRLQTSSTRLAILQLLQPLHATYELRQDMVMTMTLLFSSPAEVRDARRKVLPFSANFLPALFRSVS